MVGQRERNAFTRPVWRLLRANQAEAWRWRKEFDGGGGPRLLFEIAEERRVDHLYQCSLPRPDHVVGRDLVFSFGRVDLIQRRDERAVVLDETDSNWSSSSLVSWWDWLHGTMRLDIAQSEIHIGVAAYQRPEDVMLGKITTLPFRKQRDDWVAPDGTPHKRRSRASTAAQRRNSLQDE